MTKNGVYYKHFPLSCLSAHSLACFKFACSQLLPFSHVSKDVTWDRAVLVYAFMTRVPIDVGLFIYNAMLQTASNRCYGLWFPSLTTTSCREASMVREHDMEILLCGRYIIPLHHQQPPPHVGYGGQSFAGLSIGR